MFLMLGYLAFPAETPEVSLDIRRLALTSRSFFHFMSERASHIERFIIASIRELEVAGAVPTLGNSRTPLAILCKRLFGLCSFCNREQAHYEVFSNLQVCEICEIVFFPRVSHTTLLSRFIDTDGDECPWVELDN